MALMHGRPGHCYNELVVSRHLFQVIDSHERGRRAANNMADVFVLDTSALIEWPISAIIGSLIVPGQESELQRISPGRREILESMGAIQMEPGSASLEVTTNAAIKTGDMSGLSAIDLSLIALAHEKSAILVTDDYRMQNVSSSIGVEWRGIGEEGITEAWKWELRCIGCKASKSPPKSPNLRRSEFGQCPECGSEMKLKKI
tara:strand:- start:18853 stop:19458 length:606 start_codon:yes stop_codon:yes gene_type:complete